MNVNYLNDSDLDFLQHCSEEQLANFARLLTHNEKGKTRLSSVLMRNELFKSMEGHPEQHRRNWQLIAGELQYMLEMFFRADIALAPLLDAINSVPGFWSTVSLACLLNRYCEDYIRDNQDDIDNVITTQINAWARNNHPLLKERARQAIENPLKQPEPMTEYQVWEDDWIIDECLCAMYDASSESPGK